MAKLKSSPRTTSTESTLPVGSPKTSSPSSLTENCLIRRSPRFSSTPSKCEETTSKKKQRVSKSEDAWDLSVYEEPLPLKIVDPNFSGEKSCRRPPRFAGDVNGAPIEVRLPNSPHALSPSGSNLMLKCLRRSPRFSPDLAVSAVDGSGVILGKSEGKVESIEWPELSEKRQRFGNALSPSSLRRSPRFSAEISETGGDGSDVNLKESEGKMESIEWSGLYDKRQRFGDALSPSCLRRSPRLSSSLPETGSDGSNVIVSKSAGNLIEWPETSEKRRRIEHALCDSPDLQSSKRASKACLAKCELSENEKCLRRFPRLSSSSIGDEIENLKFELLELPTPSSKKQSSKKTKTGLVESDLNVVVEKCSKFQKIENEENKSDSSKLRCDDDDVADNNALENSLTNLGSCDGKTVSEKCLRSRKIPFRITTENVETNSTSIAFHVNSVDKKTPASSEKKQSNQKITSFFVGEPVPDEEARQRWQWRYDLKSQRYKGRSWKLNADEEDEIILNVECHYTQAEVDGCIFNLGDCAYVKGNGREKHVGRIVEFFKTMEGDSYFRVQWFYKAQDTVMKDAAASHDKKRLFYSSLMNDNLLDCIVSKVTVTQKTIMLGLKSNSNPSSDFYYDMEYCVEYSTFRNLTTDTSIVSHDSCLPDQFETLPTSITMTPMEDMPSRGPHKDELVLLDLYSGCGGMSTGLCLGARLANVNLVTKWAVDYDSSACDSLKLNHPETLVRNESAEDFLDLLKEWEKLCKKYVVDDLERTLQSESKDFREAESNITSPLDAKTNAREYEVSRLVDICYGDLTRNGKRGLKFKVRWKGYGPSEDTWEPIEGLSNCQERLWEFVRSGLESKMLPLPGDVDVICGGPPCQGISGYNRFRNVDAPLDDERNRQIIVFMDLVKFLKPKYVLMENVTDILRFDKGSLGRYALSRLIHMKYQARLGIIAAGCFGVPQFRLRVFLWGALPSEQLPQFPLPTHDVIVRYWPPPEFEQNTVAYNEGQPRDLEEAVILRDALSDLPAVSSHEIREEMTYEMPPETKFQRYVRSSKDEIMGFASSGATESTKPILYDHRPHQMSEDDYLRVCQIPHVKGANFRDLPGVVVGVDNVVCRDPTKEQVMLPSGKPLVPDWAFNFEKGKSRRPYARLWWDETVATVVTFPHFRSQAALHPEQDRVLTIREFARLQGFPDFYRFCGTVKERYCQVGNAVAVPVSRALGYTLGMAFQKLGGSEPLATLPHKFSYQRSRDEISNISMVAEAL